jgi:hypothetical protein
VAPAATRARRFGAAGRSRVLLADGTPAIIRPLNADDLDELLALHEEMPDRDR